MTDLDAPGIHKSRHVLRVPLARHEKPEWCYIPSGVTGLHASHVSLAAVTHHRGCASSSASTVLPR
jgi:hypothetical protein